LIARLLVAGRLAWCFARPTPLACDVNLSEEELDRLAFEADESVEPLVEFGTRVIRQLYPRFQRLPAHWHTILQRFELARYGGQHWRINMPPRHGKTLCALLAIAWAMKYWPTLRHAYATYGQEFSETQGRTLAKILAIAGVALSVARADVFETPEGGACYITSIDGPLLGKGVDGLFVLDDPYKNDKEAASPVTQEAVWDWYQGTARSRLEGNPSVYLMHQRWGIEDISGRLEDAGADYRALVIPAINDNGEALWPEVKSLAELRSIQHDEEYVFASMYQQQPIPRGSEMFRAPQRYDVNEWLASLGAAGHFNFRWAIGLDPAISEKTSADHSAAVLMAVEGEAEQMVARVVDVEHVQKEGPEVVDLAVAMRRRWAAQVGHVDLVVEKVGLGGKFVQDIRRMVPRGEVNHIIAWPVSRDKRTRATPMSGAWNGGRVLVPTTSSAAWADRYVLQHRRFTGKKGGKDDLIDAGAYTWTYLWRGESDLPDESNTIFELG